MVKKKKLKLTNINKQKNTQQNLDIALRKAERNREVRYYNLRVLI